MPYQRSSYARSDQIRVHLFMDGVGPAAPDPLYYSCLGVDALTHDIGDITPVEVPDPDRYGEYIIVDGIPGQRSRWTTTLTTRMPVGEESPLRSLDRRNCAIDIHLTRGICDVPSDYNQFAELEIWEDVLITSYSTSALASLSSDQRESTTEQVDVSIGKAYKIYNMLYGLTSVPSEAAATPAGIVIAPSWCCGSSECGVMFVASKGKLHFVTRGADTATTFSLTDIGAILAVGNRLIIARDDLGLDVAMYDKNGIINGSQIATATPMRALTGIANIDCAGSNGRRGIVSSEMVVYSFDATATSYDEVDLTSLCGTSATKLGAVSIAEDGTYVAISDKGAVMYSQDGLEWKAATVCPGTTPVGTAVAALNLECWLIGNTAGEIYLTSDTGVTWTKVLDVSGTVNDIKKVTNHVAYAAIGASLYRSTDAGATWSLEPNVVGRTFVSVTSVNFLSPCPDNPNNIAMAVVASSALRVVSGRPG